ncbi:MAG TPA: single-stranded-DNA-specific exonuclease RecJ [Dissulfurispiraceae bacterium]|nr:single-stranded-DNA-specific exonuclease RecJ [Dissulfurispiraceae bacterium]
MSRASAKSRWLVTRTNREYVDYVARLSGLSSPLSQALINRGIKTAEQLDSFLNPRLTMLGDPFDLPGMRQAVRRVSEAVKSGETIFIHGDYDADGVTAAAILVNALERLGARPLYHIPARKSGYGLGAEGIRKAREAGASLIITVDCGITSFDAISAAKSFGIDVIVTDHHEPSRNGGPDHAVMLPDAFAIINPKLASAGASYADLSGAGVAFRLAQALHDNNLDKVMDLIDLAAIGTAADIVPVTGDNRIILKEGLSLIQAGTRPAIKALKDVSGIAPGAMRASSMHFMLVPRINAAGRIADATDVVKFLLTESVHEAARLAEWLNGLNALRQEIGESVYDEAMGMMLKGDLDSAGAVVVAKEGWHRGVLGIVSARITDAFYRPSFVLSIEDGIAKGSARSIPSFDIHEGLSRCNGMLHAFGGHKQAAGLTLAASDIDAFRSVISRIVLNVVTLEDMTPLLRIDAPLTLSDVTADFVQEITRLEPFGCGNEEPLFGAKGLEVSQSRVVGNNHLKLYLKQNGKGIEGIGFGLGDMIEAARPGTLVDAAFVPVMNEWEGGRSLQLNLKSIREMKSMSARGPL